MSQKQGEIKSPAGIKLKTLKDLVRLVISTIGPERSSGYIGYYREENKTMYFVFNTSIGYYELRALPILIWAEDSALQECAFLRYKTSPKEEMDFSNDGSDPKWLNIPLVSFEKMPEYLKVWKN
jgi:hypothetical protein